MSTTADEVDEDDFGDFAATSDPSEPFSASEPDPRNNSEDEPETLAPEPEPAPETPKSAAFDDIFDFKSAFAAAPKTVEAALKEADAFLVLDAPVSPRMSESRRSEDEGPNGEVIDAFGAVNADLGAEEGAEMEREDTELARTPEPPTPTSAINDPAQEDDFGDFEAEAGEQSVSVAGEGGPPEPPVPEPKPSRAEEEDDDFGDFGEADDAPSELAVEPESEPTTDKAPEQSLAQAVSTNRTMDLSGLPEPDFTSKESAHATIGPLLAVLFPDAEVDSLESTLEPGPPLLVEQSDASGRTFLAPNPELKDSEWQKIFRSLAEKPTYDEASGLPLFMWRRSEVRKAWLKALQVPVNLDDMFPPVKTLKTQQAQPGTPQTPTDPAISHLLDLPEQDLRRMTLPQLREITAAMTKAVKDAANAYNVSLEKKQKLVDESDRHNKMIATLVQIAQIQASKGRR